MAETILHHIPRHLAGIGADKGAKLLMGGTAGAAPAAGLLALLSVWDHNHTKALLSKEYRNEIGSILGKEPESVTTHDMEKVAQVNPVIGDAVRRSRWKRNLSIAVTSLCLVTAPILAAFVGPMIAGLILPGSSLALWAATALTGFLACVAGEHILGSVGSKRLGLEEPSLYSIKHNPSRQGNLSVSEQIHYLQELHEHKKRITPEQVMTLFVTANQGLADHIIMQFGAPFSKLNDTQKLNVIEATEFTDQLQQIANSLNDGTLRAQELAFTVCGQTSGILPFKTVALVPQEELQTAPEKSFTRTLEKSRSQNQSKQKMLIKNPQVSGVVANNQHVCQEAMRSMTPRSVAATTSL